ncbi:MAG: metallophosphoesterase [Candidatus Cloacimonadales bacterium]
MHIQIISDLHLDFEQNRQWLIDNPIIPTGDVLLIAGDIVPDMSSSHAEAFYNDVSPNFPLIITTMGNHEYYGSYLDYAYPQYQKWVRDNILKLNNSAYIYKGVKFIVSTLWSKVSLQNKRLIGAKLNDYHAIKSREPEKIYISVEDTNSLHRQSLDFIVTELEKPFAGKIVVMTHHLPSFSTITLDRRFSPLREAFCTNLDDLIEIYPQIALWVCGHSHDFSMIKLHNTTIVRNPLGYVFRNEHSDFKRDFSLEI